MGKQRGFSLIELVIFISVIAILMAGVFKGISRSLVLATVPDEAVKASFLANARMEILLYQRATNGLSGTVDPCPTPVNTNSGCATTPAICNQLCSFAGFGTNEFTITTAPATFTTPTTTISVTVTGKADETLLTTVSNY